ncbi:MAG TPA: Sec-independent protein translocase protein TatB [Rhizomicrobium sp.]|nr:Sec-independent protein translocase protein TatB [Rhizomicrobium sp.]
MFDIFSWQHIIILLVVALVVVGPKDLPRLMNMMGKWAGKARAMAGEFRRSFDEMARESELAELRKEIDNLKKNNPISDLASSVADVEAEVSSSMDAVAPAQMAETAAEIVEPRSGEFAVTDTAPRPRNAPIVETP